ncbi:uncharacterized protein LAESUDRAFT_301160 [Laetiporus sulphureus 93-53]|uniref:Uncharacterized protein n=1 Tax=Laetiporus sulphureus 93-53 TaxID=1314785 RepID=A0A165DCF1_9APHY|nr:uncharacterized protein LAESUDRAFT_301160 [Laetiporus sulphureus 93-53]KZT04557.1 hypothetical protein LAESUDRAFT_301160 [Laetiporus sulphureus 93-53]
MPPPVDPRHFGYPGGAVVPERLRPRPARSRTLSYNPPARLLHRSFGGHYHQHQHRYPYRSRSSVYPPPLTQFLRLCKGTALCSVHIPIGMTILERRSSSLLRVRETRTS